ncbi:MAG TPA: PD-(D/E)XK nuclease family protein, partial [Candidatus Binataceae bacterium]|nr:PD-(D/E)XK nuclease family protein [Candidatus Binataceae bacterium]
RGAELGSAIARALAACASGKLSSAEQVEIGRDLGAYLELRPGGERALAREVPFFLNLADDGLQLFIRGQIDLLVECGDTIVVRDYKYAQRRDEDAAHYQIAMECYRLAAAEAYPERDVRAELVFLRGGAETCDIRLPSLEASRSRLLRIGRAMLAAQAGGDYPKKPPEAEQCYRLRCGYVRRCWKA